MTYDDEFVDETLLSVCRISEFLDSSILFRKICNVELVIIKEKDNYFAYNSNIQFSKHMFLSNNEFGHIFVNEKEIIEFSDHLSS
jgi:hypothetical protein